ncbi:MAG: hypothetical protein CL521_03375 [Actinobacteria bacterium]|nr:hypothetical protein [Actinomycetota bacterium]
MQRIGRGVDGRTIETRVVLAVLMFANVVNAVAAALRGPEGSRGLSGSDNCGKLDGLSARKVKKVPSCPPEGNGANVTAFLERYDCEAFILNQDTQNDYGNAVPARIKINDQCRVEACSLGDLEESIGVDRLRDNPYVLAMRDDGRSGNGDYELIGICPAADQESEDASSVLIYLQWLIIIGLGGWMMYLLVSGQCDEWCMDIRADYGDHYAQGVVQSRNTASQELPGIPEEQPVNATRPRTASNSGATSGARSIRAVSSKQGGIGDGYSSDESSTSIPSPPQTLTNQVSRGII